MSRADWIYLTTTNKILKSGIWDINEKVRPKWSDGTSAHTAKVFAVNNVYDLEEEFPIVTLRYTNWKAAIDEILWIWQLKSNNVKDLNSHIWDQWADSNGSIGKAYGWQIGQKAIYKEGEFDQIERVIWYLKNQPAFRSIVTEIFVHKDLHEMGLYPCVHGMQFDVTNGKLNLFLNQRSNDTLAAGSWNVVQYAALVYMLAQVCNLKPGILSHMIVNSHIYDRHIPYIIDLTLSRAKLIKEKLKNLDKNNLKNSLSKEEYEKFNVFYNNVVYNEINFEFLIEQARGIEEKIGKSEKNNINENDIINEPIKLKEYCENVIQTEDFKLADYIVENMFENPTLEKILGFTSPKLVLDTEVKDFYDFKSPKAKDNDGNIIDNKETSFSVDNYNYEEYGVKLKSKVPVAE